MVMARNAPITDYFKKLNQAQQMKRPFPDDGSEESRGRSTRWRSSTSSLTTDAGVQSGNCSFLTSDKFFQFSAGLDEMTSSQQALAGQRALPNRTVAVTAPDSYIEPEPPRYSSLSPVLWATMTPATSQQAPLSITVEDITNGEEQPCTPTVPPLARTSSRHDVVPGSQIVLTSSQRIVRDGEVLIRNSDDESDDSLEDLDKLLSVDRHSRKPSPRSTARSPYLNEEVGMQTRRKIAKGTHADRPYSALSVKPKKYKYSLDVLAKQKKQDEAAKENISRAQSLYESLEQRSASSVTNRRPMNADFIESVMKDHGDEENIGRLRTAIQRTEALEQEKSWSFFKENAEDPSLELTDFPAVEDERLQRLFGQKLPRQQAFLSGYAGEYAMKAVLPEEVMLWIMDAICMESRDDLRHSYISTLSDAKRHFTPILTPTYINKLFQQLGATPAAIDINTTVVPHVNLAQNVATSSRPSLLSALILLGSVAGELAADSRIHLLSTLCRLALDHSLVKDCHAISAVEEAFANLVDSISEESLKRELQPVLTTVYHTVSDAGLRLQLLHIIPAWSSRLLLLRQRLALAFFFQDSRYLSKQPEDLVDLRSIARRLEGPQFSIRKDTDFGELAASIGILSIGIDGGDPPLSPATKEEEAVFNHDVDSLSSKINYMFSDIIDTGASQMKRTEAKEVLEGFQRRLEFSIRTKPKAKKLIFGNAEISPLTERIDVFVKKTPTVV